MNAVVRLLAIFCIAVLAFGAATGTGAAQASGGQLVVELETDGDADAVFTDEFDLTDGDDRELFEEVQASAELRDAAAGQFGEEMQFVSDAASEGIDREIGVEAVTVETAVDGETGIVAYRFRWVNLAAVDDGNVTLSEPFSTYDSLDRELVVFAPEGYELTSVSPQPERQGTDVATWPGLTEFGGNFEVVATAPGAADDGTGLDPIEHEPTNADVYGGAPVALGVSVLLLGFLLIGRKR